MNTVWKDKGKGIGKSGDLLLTRRNERRYAELGGTGQFFGPIEITEVVITLNGQLKSVKKVK